MLQKLNEGEHNNILDRIKELEEFVGRRPTSSSDSSEKQKQSSSEEDEDEVDEKNASKQSVISRKISDVVQKPYTASL